MVESGRPRVLLAYHFFHPDEVVSARLFTDLALGLSARGWLVTALTSNRSWSSPSTYFPRTASLGDIVIERAFRPPWDQARPVERLGNSAWLSVAWLARIARFPRQDAVVIGSDPAFAPGILPAIRRLWPRAYLAHWCYDLYPEAIVADGTTRATRALLPVARRVMASAYRTCDAIVDLGPRMRERLAEYPSRARRETIVPWALVEAAEVGTDSVAAARRALFGEAKLGLLYSGTLGRAHDFAGFLELARSARRRFGSAVAVAFACRGNRLGELRDALSSDDTNVRVVDFCDEAQLGAHLASADVHLLSLRAEWSGLVVPSKFFGSLAVGRPVIYAGPPDSDVALWIEETNVGWTLGPTGLPLVLDALANLLVEPAAVKQVQDRAQAVYQARFRKTVSLDRWDALLRGIAVTSAQAARLHPGTSERDGPAC